ncbi:LOW QUALITY PROTEIN: signal-induced proliferation-associated 1-like protein 2 [Diaphorina citri]|uniref:LOW QUALITY PROTEIN: signal-induced proliferation-associated 1-like protein 2 n=1 Tax=Diaphorina citri TaxID=121845 RepID=A0A3Q0IWF1_DIACI|nr:LOW QUALITY PROTEIN: signal-induced proliferation-associated 1-like protein 2 [Diaphorina citri]
MQIDTKYRYAINFTLWSNSSLELMHAESGDSLPHGVSNPTLRREYGSHGSIDVISNNGGPVSESFFAMLQDYRPTPIYRSNSSLELMHAESGDSLPHGVSNPTLRREYGSHGSIDVISNNGGPVSESFFAMLQDYRPTVLGMMVTDQRSPGPAEYLRPRAESGDSLPHGVSNPTLRREYGSHGSIDVISNNGGPVSESFFAMLQDYRPTVLGMMVTDQRSPGPAEYLRPRGETVPSNSDVQSSLSSSLVDETDGRPSGGSPNLKLKFQRLFGGQSGGAGGKPLRAPSSLDDSSLTLSPQSNGIPSSLHNGSPLDPASDQVSGRRRVFAHYDVPSVSANLGYAARVRSMLLARRRNTSTGASAASSTTRASTPDSDEDGGDGRCNHLIESCPFFRNEIGGEGVREVSLSRLSSPPSPCPGPLHRPPLAYGVAILEYPEGETHWKHGTCPYQNIRHIESVDAGALYYRKYFYGQEHQNWLGMDDNLGPVAISLKREKVEYTQESQQMYRYRLLIRTSELQTLRGSVLEDNIPNLKPSSSSNSKSLNAKEVLEYVAPEVQLSCLRLGVSSQAVEDQLLKLDEQALTSHYKVGVMYCRAGQSTEEDMYNNEEAGPALNEFLDTIGHRVRLKGFEKYRAGLDNKTNGDYTAAPHYSVIYSAAPRVLTFTTSHNSTESQGSNIVAVSRSKEVPLFGPPIPENATFNKSKEFRDFLLSKIINGENAAHRSEKFATMATRTRQEYLKDLTQNYATSTLIEPSQKFSMPLFSSKKKERWRPRIIPDTVSQQQVPVSNAQRKSSKPPCPMHRGRGKSACKPSDLGVGKLTITPSKSAASPRVQCTEEEGDSGTSSNGNTEERGDGEVTATARPIATATPPADNKKLSKEESLRLYHHQGEVTRIHMREGGGGDRDELMEVVVRLRAATPGSPAQELTLKRNGLGQLGFHVQPDGLVTEVEHIGLAYQEGLKQGCRLVEICKVAVSTLSHDQMVDLLKTSSLMNDYMGGSQSSNVGGDKTFSLPNDAGSPCTDRFYSVQSEADSTGLYSVYSEHQGCQVMFHVSPLLPFTPHNRQLQQKTFKPGSLPFTPKTIRSQFQHVFIVVRALNPNTDHTQYSVAVSRSKEVPLFGPPIPENATFNKSKEFRDFLLSKIVNGENAAHRSEKFATMATRTRQEYLKDLTQNYATSTLIEPSQKFSMPLFSSKKKERWRPRIIPDTLQKGAIFEKMLFILCCTTFTLVILSVSPSYKVLFATRDSNSKTIQGLPDGIWEYERSFSPPRSSNSSGYGTGSSSRSFMGVDNRFPVSLENPSSTHPSSGSPSVSTNPPEERWYDTFDPSLPSTDSPPPPLPARILSHPKVSSSSSLPLSNSTLSLSHEEGGAPHEFKVGEKVTNCLIKASERSHELRRHADSNPHLDYHHLTLTRTGSKMNDYMGGSQSSNVGGDKTFSLPNDAGSPCTDRFFFSYTSIREMRRRHTLEEELKDLREENKKLKEESQNALQQLRRFTEWFFQTIDKQ